MTLQESAMIAVRDCMGAKPGERVLIVSDTERNFVGLPMYHTALDLGCEAMYMEMKPRTRSGEEPPKAIAHAMLHADVVLVPTKFSITHTQARKDASANGARIATIPLTEGDEKLLTRMLSTGGLTADYHKMERQISRILQKLKAGREARITTDLGTDILLDLRHREWHTDTGLALKSGDFTNLPGGEVFIAPFNANGKVVIDGTFGDFGLLQYPLELTVKDGFVTEAKGDKAEELNKLFDLLGPNARNIAELGIGMNPKASLIGVLLEDEKVGNTVHIALGNNMAFGGNVNVSIHYDGIITKPNLYIDDEKIILKDYL